LKEGHLSKEKDNFHGPYIKNEPVVEVFPIGTNERSIVLGSDGLWDFTSKGKVAELSLKENPEREILN
jgi:serine/threonine protein phosphatase PrpC